MDSVFEKKLTIGEIDAEPGTMSFEWEVDKDAETGSIYLDNDCNIEIKFLEITHDLDKLKIGKDVGAGKIDIETGEFKVKWMPGESDYNLKAEINNGIITGTILYMAIKVGSIDVTFQLGTSVCDYSNLITVQIRLASLNDVKLYVDTQDYLELDILEIIATSNNWEIQLNISQINIMFEEYYIKYYNGEVTKGGSIDWDLDLGAIDLSFKWRNQNNQIQEIILNFCKPYPSANPQTYLLTVDTNGCTEENTINFPSFEIGQWELSGYITLNKNKISTIDWDANPIPINSEGLGTWHFNFDTGDQTIGDISLIARRYISALNKDIGINMNINSIRADNFNRYGTFDEIMGIWIPTGIGASGNLVATGTVKFLRGDNTWEKIWPKISVDAGGPYSAEEDQTIQFSGSAWGGLKPYSWSWDFGDGHTSTEKNPTHSYSSAGQYTVSLTVTGLLGINTGSDVTNADISSDDSLNVAITWSGKSNGRDLYEEEIFTAIVTDEQTGSPISNADITYRAWHVSSSSSYDDYYGTTNSNGEIDFTAVNVPWNYYTHYRNCKVYADKNGIVGESNYFRVYDIAVDLHGYIKDYVTHYGIPDALVEAENSENYNYTYSQDYPGEGASQDGKFKMGVAPGVYTLTASKNGYNSESLYNIDASEPGDYIFLEDMYLHSTSYGGIHGTVYDSFNNRKIGGVTVTVQQNPDIWSKTGYFGSFPTKPTYDYYSFKLNPGTYTLIFTKDDYHTYTKTNVVVNSGDITELEIYIDPCWISPMDHNDQYNKWDDENQSYDRYTDTKATCTITDGGWQWTPFIELELESAITTDKIRFWAWYDDDYTLCHCDAVDIDLLFNDGSTYDLYNGAFADREWVNVTFTSKDNVIGAQVSFHVRKWTWDSVIADLHEFQFYQ